MRAAGAGVLPAGFRSQEPEQRLGGGALQPVVVEPEDQVEDREQAPDHPLTRLVEDGGDVVDAGQAGGGEDDHQEGDEQRRSRRECLAGEHAEGDETIVVVRRREGDPAEDERRGGDPAEPAGGCEQREEGRNPQEEDRRAQRYEGVRADDPGDAVRTLARRHQELGGGQVRCEGAAEPLPLPADQPFGEPPSGRHADGEGEGTEQPVDVAVGDAVGLERGLRDDEKHRHGEPGQEEPLQARQPATPRPAGEGEVHAERGDAGQGEPDPSPAEHPVGEHDQHRDRQHEGEPRVPAHEAGLVQRGPLDPIDPEVPPAQPPIQPCREVEEPVPNPLPHGRHPPRSPLGRCGRARAAPQNGKNTGTRSTSSTNSIRVSGVPTLR